MNDNEIQDPLRRAAADLFGDDRRRLKRVVEAAGFKWDAVYRKLRGDRQLPAPEVARLGAVIGVDANWLLYGVGSPWNQGLRLLLDAVSITHDSRPLGQSPVGVGHLSAVRAVDPSKARRRRGRPATSPKTVHDDARHRKQKNHFAESAVGRSNNSRILSMVIFFHLIARTAGPSMTTATIFRASRRSACRV